jgi:hypothetical protein
MKISPAVYFAVAILSASPPVIAASDSNPKKMDLKVKHHVVRFPDCELHFDYPADLVPSADFMMDRMDSEVDYEKIRWDSPTSTIAFISMDADLRSSVLNRRLASIGLLVWLGRAPEDFEGDLLNPDNLKRAHALIGARDHDDDAYEPLSESTIHGRTWLYAKAADIHMTALNSKIFLRMRATQSGELKERDKWIGWVDRSLGTILDSLRIVPLAQPVAASTH